MLTYRGKNLKLHSLIDEFNQFCQQYNKINDAASKNEFKILLNLKALIIEINNYAKENEKLWHLDEKHEIKRNMHFIETTLAFFQRNYAPVNIPDIEVKVEPVIEEKIKTFHAAKKKNEATVSTVFSKIPLIDYICDVFSFFDNKVEECQLKNERAIFLSHSKTINSYTREDLKSVEQVNPLKELKGDDEIALYNIFKGYDKLAYHKHEETE